MQPKTEVPHIPVGVLKTFGPVGPIYAVGRPVRELINGDWLVEVELVETGEKAEYSLMHINDDPLAH